jgi:hypothetical protein
MENRGDARQFARADENRLEFRGNDGKVDYASRRA